MTRSRPRRSSTTLVRSRRDALLNAAGVSGRASRAGLTWRSALGVPRGRVALADITEVSVVQVRAGDDGGYRLSSVPGTTAVITRHGSALQVRRGSGRTFVITVDDPMAAASVVEGLRHRV